MFGKVIDRMICNVGVWAVPQYNKEIKKVKFVNKSPNEDPKYAHDGDSGFDLRAWICETDKGSKLNENGEYTITLEPLERRLIHTGIYVELPENTEAQVRSRSGLSLKQGLIVANTPGTVDNFYRNEVGVILINLSKETVTVTNGDRIAQMVICPVYLKELINLEKIEEVNTDTDRGVRGCGSSGVKEVYKLKLSYRTGIFLSSFFVKIKTIIYIK